MAAKPCGVCTVGTIEDMQGHRMVRCGASGRFRAQDGACDLNEVEAHNLLLDVAAIFAQQAAGSYGLPVVPRKSE